MKVTYTIWQSEQHHVTAEHEVDSYDFNGLMEDLEKAIELRKLRTAKAKQEAAERAAEPEPPAPPANEPVHRIELRESDGTDGRPAGSRYYVCNFCLRPDMHTRAECNPHWPHGRVYEYDGAFKCLECHSTWGAISGSPRTPPNLCTTNDSFHL